METMITIIKPSLSLYYYNTIYKYRSPQLYYIFMYSIYSRALERLLVCVSRLAPVASFYIIIVPRLPIHKSPIIGNKWLKSWITHTNVLSNGVSSSVSVGEKIAMFKCLEPRGWRRIKSSTGARGSKGCGAWGTEKKEWNGEKEKGKKTLTNIEKKSEEKVEVRERAKRSGGGGGWRRHVRRWVEGLVAV